MQSYPDDHSSLDSLAQNLGIETSQLSDLDIDINQTSDWGQASGLDDLSQSMAQQDRGDLSDISQANLESMDCTSLDHLNALHQHPKWLHSDEITAIGSHHIQADLSQNWTTPAIPDSDAFRQSHVSDLAALDHGYTSLDAYQQENSYLQPDLSNLHQGKDMDQTSLDSSPNDGYGDKLFADITTLDASNYSLAGGYSDLSSLGETSTVLHSSSTTVYHKHYLVPPAPLNWSNGGDDHDSIADKDSNYPSSDDNGDGGFDDPGECEPCDDSDGDGDCD